MKKPLCTKLLALLASVLILLNCMFHIFLILIPDISVLKHTSFVETPEIPIHSTVLLMTGTATILPFLAVCIYNAFTSSTSFTKALVSAILSGVFWIGSIYCALPFNSLAISSAGSTDVIAAISAINMSRGFLPNFNAISFALMCSALAIEMYIAKTKESPSVQSVR